MAEGLAQRIPYPALGDLVKWLEAEGVPYVIIGGLSVSIVSQPRPTIDVDLVVWLHPERWNVFLESGTRYGIKPREADALEFARKRRVLLLEHADTGIGIDVSFGALPFEQEMIDRATRVSIGGVELRVATPEDLIVMKMIAHREKDLRDIDNIMRVCQELDLERIKYWLHEFALVLETPELDSEFADMIQRHS
jgi:predicted nucleotidyltransferase